MPDTPSSNTAAAITVTQLAGLVKAALADGVPGKLRVVGEISNLSDRNHWFFSLKDQGAAIRCVCFASNARRIRFPVRDGMAVVATGRIDFYDAQGSVQLYVETIEPVGEGALELALRQLIAELRELGYFEPDRKLPAPAVPRRVAVVTSRSAAALQDVINTAGRRWPGFELLLVDVRVQGPDAAPQIAEALRRINRSADRLGIDAVILTRGGGSIEDLWAFNERVVADAVYDSRVPIVAAIGHETDTTIAELVADIRCSTPTQAAMTLIPDRSVLAQQVAQLDRRLRWLLGQRLEQARRRLEAAARLRTTLAQRADLARHRLDAAARHPLMARPGRLVDQARQRLAQAQLRLHAAPGRLLSQKRQRFDRLVRHLEAVGPRQVLRRGYTYTTDAKGELLRSATQAAAGQPITTVFHDGKVASTVDDGGRPGSAAAPPAPGKKKKKTRKPADEGPMLFLAGNDECRSPNVE